MLFRLILLFTLVPALELTLILVMGHYIGFAPTLIIIFGAGILGAALARSQGLYVLRRIQMDLAAGRVPAYGLIDGLIILIAAVLLIAPGFLTDIVGLLLLLPPIRALVKQRIRVAMERALRRGTLRFFPFR